MTSTRGESGRSMVEMLGTLAIIGVLSVGGIAGYTYAMDKHYANELLMGASERAVLVTAQIVAGKTPNLNEFAHYPNVGGTFGQAAELEDGSGFIIPVSGVKESICKNLIQATEGTDITIAKDDGETLTDITEEECDDENDNDLLFVFETGIGGAEEETDPACADVECEDGLMCFHGECKCPNGVFMCGDQCCAEGTYCAKGTNTSTYICAEPTGDGDCTKNSDCKDAEGNVDTTKYCEFSGGDSTGPTGGTCTDKGTLTPYTLNLPGGALTVYKSSGTMNWWSAVNFCEAHDKKQLVTMADLGIADSGTNTGCYFNPGNSDYATKPCICNGGSDSDCSATNVAIRSTDVFGESGSLWLADNSKSSSCATRYVSLSKGAVLDDSRYSGYLYNSAICRDP